MAAARRWASSAPHTVDIKSESEFEKLVIKTPGAYIVDFYAACALGGAGGPLALSVQRGVACWCAGVAQSLSLSLSQMVWAVPHADACARVGCQGPECVLGIGADWLSD